jgi:hypothetical protein
MQDSAPTSIEDQLRELERRRLRAFVERDMALLAEIHAPDYELITPGGVSLSRDGYLSGVEANEFDYRVFEAASEIRVRAHGDMAVLRYIARIEMQLESRLDTGRFWHTDVYELRGGTWQVLWSHATRIRSD